MNPLPPLPDEPRYRRLPARGNTGTLPRWAQVLLAAVTGPLALLFRGARQELWEGEDHLLIVENNGYSERYRRIRFEAIQAIQQWPTSDYLATGAALAVAASLWAIGALILWGNPLAFGIAGIAALFAILLVWHAARGPTCRTRIRTAVQNLELPALGRTRPGRVALHRLRERITASQGILPAEQILAVPWDPQEAPASPGPAAGDTPQRPEEESAPVPPQNFRAHWVVTILCLSDPLFAGITFLIDSGWLDGLTTLLMVVAAFASVVAIREHRRHTWSPELRALPWMALASIGLSIVAGLALGIAAVFHVGVDGIDDLDWRSYPPIVAATLLFALINLGIGLFGMTSLRRAFGRRRQGPPAFNPTSPGPASVEASEPPGTSADGRPPSRHPEPPPP